MDLNEADFSYNATLKLIELPRCTALGVFPGVSDIAVNSRHFSSYTECISSAKALMQDVVKDVNKQLKKKQFTIATEINPEHSGTQTRSRDWNDDELARLWIFDKREEGALNIHAVGQARIFMLERTAPTKLLN